MDALVHIIDDDESVRHALDSLFRSVDIDTQLHRSAQDFLRASRPDCPSCLVLDIRLPGINGLDFQEHLTQLNIQVPVVLMTGHGDIPMSVRGMKAGAVDFLTKPFRDQDMLDAVTHALDLDRKRREGEVAASGLRARFESLTPRQKEVLALVTSGLMNKQVAGLLDVSEITVKIHRGQVMKKMEAKSLAELVKMAEMLGISRKAP